MKTTIKQTQDGYVSVRHCVDGEFRAVYVFSVPKAGGYVRRADGGQVCKNLSRTGETLRATPENLLNIIRSEWRGFMRQSMRRV
jgi:hypothetical protein